jgi:hypothetical protein
MSDRRPGETADARRKPKPVASPKPFTPPALKTERDRRGDAAGERAEARRGSATTKES